MANTMTLIGSGTVIFERVGNQIIVDDFVTGDAFTLEYPNDIANIDIGKNGDCIITYDAKGQLANVTVRVIKGGETDKFLRTAFSAYKKQKASYVPMTADVTGEFGDGIDKGDGEGTLRKLHFKLTAGFVIKGSPYVENYSGDTSAGISIHQLRFNVEDDSFI